MGAPVAQIDGKTAIFHGIATFYAVFGAEPLFSRESQLKLSPKRFFKN
jgi:hypothetical protein